MTDRTDWATLHRSDPVIWRIYCLVQADAPRPTPESVAASDIEMKSLCAQYDRLSMINGEILCRNFVSDKPGKTHRQIVVPSALCREIVVELHRELNGGHLGYRRAKATVCRRFYWPGWATDVRLAKKRYHQCAKFQQPWPHRRLSTHVDWRTVGKNRDRRHRPSSHLFVRKRVHTHSHRSSQGSRRTF